MATEAIIRQFLGAESSRDWATMEKLIHPDITYTAIGSPKPVRGRQNYIRYMKETYEQLPDWHFEIVHLLTKEDGAIVEFDGTGHFSGTYKGTKHKLSQLHLSAVCVFELRDGKIYREREYWDSQGYDKQLTRKDPIQSDALNS